MLACGPARHVQKTQAQVTITDTTSAANVAIENKIETKKEDSVTAGKEIFDKVIRNKIDFTTFSAKVRLQYESKDGSDDGTAYIRLKKDSALWLSLRGPLGIEGFRVLVTRDSVKLMDLLKKNVVYRGIDYLQEMTGIPLDFATLQDLVVGNPVFISTDIVSHHLVGDNQLEVLMQGSIFKHLLTLDNTDDKMLHSRLDDVEAGQNRSCEITFNNYENKSGVLFSTNRKISINDQSVLDIHLDFKQYSFNQPVAFLFNVPKNYKRL